MDLVSTHLQDTRCCYTLERGRRSKESWSGGTRKSLSRLPVAGNRPPPQEKGAVLRDFRMKEEHLEYQ